MSTELQPQPRVSTEPEKAAPERYHPLLICEGKCGRAGGLGTRHVFARKDVHRYGSGSTVHEIWRCPCGAERRWG